MSTLPTNPNHPFPKTSNVERPTSSDTPYPRLASDPPHLHPAKLFQLLEQGISSYADLQAQLNCSVADLRETLASPDSRELLELQSALSAMQLQILALKAAPAALQNLIDLQKESPSPLVRCRSSEKILTIAGTPTLAAKAQPAEPLLERPEEEKPDEEAIFQRVIAVLPLSDKQKQQMEKAHHHPIYRRRYFTPEQDHLFNAALKGKRIPIPPLTPPAPRSDTSNGPNLKSEIANWTSSDPSSPQPPRAA